MTRNPRVSSQAARAASEAGDRSYISPPISTTRREDRHAKSTMYGPINAFRRNLKPSSLLSRTHDQRSDSTLLIVRRRYLASWTLDNGTAASSIEKKT
jgi:hypothetical protein